MKWVKVIIIESGSLCSRRPTVWLRSASWFPAERTRPVFFYVFEEPGLNPSSLTLTRTQFSAERTQPVLFDVFGEPGLNPSPLTLTRTRFSAGRTRPVFFYVFEEPGLNPSPLTLTQTRFSAERTPVLFNVFEEPMSWCAEPYNELMCWAIIELSHTVSWAIQWVDVLSHHWVEPYSELSHTVSRYAEPYNFLRQ